MPSVFEDLEANVATAAKQDVAQASLTAIAASVATPPLATGAATSAKQDTANTSVASIDTKTPALVSGNVPVALSSANITSLTPPAAITGYATSAKQDTELASLASIDGKIPAQSAGTLPVSLPAATVTALTPTSRASLVSTVNSTSANLAGAAVFTGTSEDVKDYAVVQIAVFSSHASATDGLSLQQSIDGTNWDIIDTFTVPAATGKTFSVQVAARYYRLVYTNGATLTTSLRISSTYHYVASRSASQRPSDARANENDFDESLSYLMGYDGTSSWNRLRSTTANGLAVDVTRLSALVAGSATVGSIASITTGIVPGVAATSLGKAEDAVHASGDTGVQALGVRNDNAATDMTSGNGDYSSLATDIKGAQFVRDRTGSAAVTSVAYVATTSTTLIAANAARRGLTIFNNSTVSGLYINLAGGTASATTGASQKIAVGGYYEVPAPCTTTAVTGFWETGGTGSANITEFI